jgi:hypothetical protein
MRTKRNATRNPVAITAIVLFIILLVALFNGVEMSFIIMGGFLAMILLFMMVFADSIVDETAIMRRLSGPMDLSEIRRVIAESSGGLEIIVRGSLETTYREACLDYWDFKRIRKNDNWIIVDERGNDITNITLDSYNGPAKLVLIGGPTTSSRSTYDEVEKYDEASESDYGVTYYD